MDMTQEQQEALSHQHYGHWVVPLESGRVAVFSHPNGKLLSICEWSEVKSVPIKARVLDRVPRTELTLDELLSV